MSANWQKWPKSDFRKKGKKQNLLDIEFYVQYVSNMSFSMKIVDLARGSGMTTSVWNDITFLFRDKQGANRPEKI